MAVSALERKTWNKSDSSEWAGGTWATAIGGNPSGILGLPILAVPMVPSWPVVTAKADGCVLRHEADAGVTRSLVAAIESSAKRAFSLRKLRLFRAAALFVAVGGTR